MKKDINIGEAKPYFPDTLPCEYDPPDTKQLDEEDYYESYNLSLIHTPRPRDGLLSRMPSSA